MASTRMACAPALMNQEDRFLKLLLNVNQARFPVVTQTIALINARELARGAQ